MESRRVDVGTWFRVSLRAMQASRWICLASHTVQHCWRQQQHLGREGACRQPNSV